MILYIIIRKVGGSPRYYEHKKKQKQANLRKQLKFKCCISNKINLFEVVLHVHVCACLSLQEVFYKTVKTCQAVIIVLYFAVLDMLYTKNPLVRFRLLIVDGYEIMRIENISRWHNSKCKICGSLKHNGFILI